MSPNNTALTIQNKQFDLAPQDFAQLTTFADLVSKSGLVPKDYIGKPGNVIVAVQMGVEIGLKPMQSLQNISVINGRPSLWGDALLALVKASGVCEYIHEEISADGETATCETKRKGELKATTRTFTIKDATKAGLMTKDNWSKYPKRMLQLRARAWALRDVYPDVLGGLQVAEEQQDKEYNDNQKIKQAPKTLEQLGLKTIEKDGYMIVQGNTHGKTDFLKKLGFNFTTDGNVWRMEIPTNNTSENDVAQDAEIVQDAEVETQSQETVIDNPIINTFDDLELYVQTLGFEIELKKSGDKTFGKLNCTLEDAETYKEILNKIGFSFYKSKGVVMNVTHLMPETITTTVEVGNDETPIKEIQHKEVKVETVAQKEIPKVAVQIQSEMDMSSFNEENELPFE
jgi:hypothetical protein